MIRVLLLLGLLGLAGQGVSTRPDETGVVTGTLRTTDGKPAAGIRVAARAVQDSLAEAEEGAALAGLAETDTMGRYRLEGVPSGRYTITAGRVDLPTYYPGTLDLASGRILNIAPGSITSGIDFTLADLSYAVAGASSQPPGVTITLRVSVEGSGKIPVFADGNFVQLVVTPDTGGNAQAVSALTAPAIVLPFPIVPRKFRATVENLPPGYTLKSMAYGSTNLITDPLTLSAADLGLSAGILAGIDAATQSRLNSGQNGTGIALVPSATLSAKSVTELSIILVSSTPVPPASGGVRVSGKLPAAGVRSVYISGKPGTLYADGTFDFQGIPPGKHVVVSSDSQLRPMGAVLVVGNRDLEGVQLEPVLLLPREAPAVAADTRPAGERIPLAGLRGQLISDATGQPMRGMLSVVGAEAQAAYVVGDDGQFQIPKLLPGSYNLQVSIFDYFTLNQTVVVGEQDTAVVLRVRRTY